jgi:hypothetical protein
VPTSVSILSNFIVKKLQDGPHLATSTETELEFWDFLASWGGAWMWSDISRDQPTYTDILWLRSGMQKGSLVWVTDSSYNRKQAKDLSGIGWVILCTDSKLYITGTFWERSQSANLYRAELLGLCTMHTLAQALQEFYHLSHWSATLCCDNKKALNMSRHHR